MSNKHLFSPNGHDQKIFNKFCDVSSKLDTYGLLEFIVENWCDDQDLEDITNRLEERFKENQIDVKVDVDVIVPKETILEWDIELPHYSAQPGAKARVVNDYTNYCEFIDVEFLDELGNGQMNGKYYRSMFK